MNLYRHIGDHEIAVTRVFDAPVERVWAAHTVPAHLQRWQTGPDGWTMPVCELDLRPGGAYRYVYRRANGTEMTMTGTVLEVEPPHRLVVTENWGEDWPETVNTLTLVERDGKTELTQAMRFPDAAALTAATQTGMEDGVAASYDRLDAVLSSPTG